MDRERYDRIRENALKQRVIFISREVTPEDSIFWNTYKKQKSFNIPADHNFVLVNYATYGHMKDRIRSFKSEEEVIDYLVTLRMNNA